MKDNFELLLQSPVPGSEVVHILLMIAFSSLSLPYFHESSTLYLL